MTASSLRDYNVLGSFVVFFANGIFNI